MPRPRHRSNHGPGYRRGMRHFFGSRMHRRIFLWFGFTIVIAVAATFTTARFLDDGPRWKDDFARVSAFVSDEFSTVWTDPAARLALAEEAHEKFAVSVTLRDAGGGELSRVGPPCPHHTFLAAPVRVADEAVGTVEVCRPPPGLHLRPVFALGVALAVLWLMALMLARYLTRPLVKVQEVAQAIGDGDLKARVILPRRVHDEAAVLANTVNEMAERIEKQLADQRELLAAVSHEMRTPLGHLRILVEMGKDATDLDKSKAQFAGIEREVAEMDALVGELLQSARLEFRELSLESVDLGVLARDALERAGLSGELLERDRGALTVQGDPSLLSRAMSNLIDNATRHGQGLVALSVRVEGETVAVEARDDGPGFANDALVSAFDSFAQGEGGLKRGTLGLGLSLVRRIADAHGGEAFARNLDVGGAAVGIKLPAHAQG